MMILAKIPYAKKIKKILQIYKFRLEGLKLRNKFDLDELKAVCPLLGPYRNLTTLLVSILNLHPSCYALNHAGVRILKKSDVNFFKNYSKTKFDNFCQTAILFSQGGERGLYGGSITLSHAFDRGIMRQTYHNRYGDSLMKDTIKSIVWKESLMVSNLIKKHNIQLADIFMQNDKLKFIMPIRNPLDCAISNYIKGHAKFFLEIKNGYSVKEILDNILKEFLWFLNFTTEYPARFFYFFQDELNEKLLVKLANFLEIEPEKRWIQDALKCCKLKPSYKYKPNLIKHYNELIFTYFKDYPAFLEHLKEFSNT